MAPSLVRGRLFQPGAGSGSLPSLLQIARGTPATLLALGLLLLGPPGTAHAVPAPPPPVLPSGVAVQLAAHHADTLAVRTSPLRSVGFDDEVRALAYSGGTVYVGGVFTHAVSGGSSTSRAYLAAVDARTGALLNWHPRVNGAVTALTTSGNSVYVAGNFTRVNGQSRTHLAKLSASTGSVDGGFRHTVSSAPMGLATGHGRVYVVGSFGSVDGRSWPDTAAFGLSSGALDTGFRPRIGGGSVHAVAVGPERVYLGGSFHQVNGSSADQRLAAVTPATGATVRSFSGGSPYVVHSVAPGPGGVYAAIGGPGGRLAFYPDGSGTYWSVTADGDVHNVGVLDDTVYAGGHFDNVCSSPRVASRNGDCLDGKVVRRKIFATDLSGHLLGWNPSANSPHGVLAMVVSGSLRSLAIGGAFTSVGGVAQRRYAEFRS